MLSEDNSHCLCSRDQTPGLTCTAGTFSTEPFHLP